MTKQIKKEEKVSIPKAQPDDISSESNENWEEESVISYDSQISKE